MSEKYSVHDYTVEQILNFIKSNEIAIPEIQRPFVWKGKQVRDLVDSLYKGYPTGYLIISKSPDLKLKDGSLSVGKKIMIDGQQRVTTISLILIPLINAMKKGEIVPEDSRLCDIIEETYIVDKYRKDERKVRLKPFRDDCEAFDRLIYKDEVDYIPESKVTINYRYFYDRIVSARELTPDELFQAIDSLEVIDIELEPEHGDNPQLIFESLNSTGLDLTESDKIRNYVLMNLPPVVQERYYDSYWNDNFIDEKYDGKIC